MNIEMVGYGPLVIVLVMAIITLITRWGGVFAMSLFPISQRVHHFISAMSGSVLVALLAPLAINSDQGARLALLATAVTMLLIKKPLIAITVGILVAAVYRQV
jgi:uncharacterized membrane protein